MPTEQAAEYLTEEENIPTKPKTMRNWRSAGRGPVCKYLGTKPLYERAELHRWAEEEALTDVCPTSRKRHTAHQQVAA
jgi:hypothetical protein